MSELVCFVFCECVCVCVCERVAGQAGEKQKRVGERWEGALGGWARKACEEEHYALRLNIAFMAP